MNQTEKIEKLLEEKPSVVIRYINYAIAILGVLLITLAILIQMV